MLNNFEAMKSTIEQLSNGEYSLIRVIDESKNRVEVKHNICIHTWELSYHSFINGTRCPKCRQELKEREFIEKVESKYGEEYTVLSNYYQNNSYVKLLHNKCGLIIYRTPKEIFQGKMCKSCRGKLSIINQLEKRICRKCSSEFYVSEIEEIENSIYINWCSIECKEAMKENICRNCGCTFMSTTKSAYCSDKCRTQVCTVCGKTYLGNYGQKFCSEICRNTFYTKTCKVCGVKFITTSKKEVCSSECAKAYSSVKSYYKICKYCRTPFVASRDDVECCSPQCTIEYNKENPKVLSNKKKLNDIADVVSYRVNILIDRRMYAVMDLKAKIDYRMIDGFSEGLKEKIRKRDNNKCFICETTNELEIHHIVPRRLGGDHTEENLITLCLKCHRYIETTEREYAVRKCIENAKKTLGIVELTSDSFNTIVPKYQLGDIKENLSKLFGKLEEVEFDEISEFKMDLADIIDSVEKCRDDIKKKL